VGIAKMTDGYQYSRENGEISLENGIGAKKD